MKTSSKAPRDTKQRTVVYNTLAEANRVGEALTAKHIVTSSNIPSATVYREIKRLLKLGELRTIPVPGAATYYALMGSAASILFGHMSACVNIYASGRVFITLRNKATLEEVTPLVTTATYRLF